MEIRTYYDQGDEYTVEAKFTHSEKYIAFKAINDIMWMVNPNNDDRPVDDN